MTFKYSDALLLGAIKLSEKKENGATLTDIVMYVDYINHAIITYSELVTGTKKLKTIRLIRERNKRFQTTDKFDIWWTRNYGQKSRFGLLKAMDEIEQYLNEEYSAIKKPWTNTKTKLIKKDLEKSTQEYFKWFDEIANKKSKKKKVEK